jgi:hypothetical protein
MVELEHAAKSAESFDHFFHGKTAMGAAISLVDIKLSSVRHVVAP